MRDMGLDEAIRAVGGVRALARKIGISQPAISNWPRVPAERVLSVEAASGIDRAILRPDLFAQPAATAGGADEVDAARAREYALVSVLLARAPTADLLRRLAQIEADTSPLGVAHSALSQAARGASEERVSQEFFDLFIGLGRGECLPYGSYYLTGFLHERPLARLRQDLLRLGIERAPGQTEPEDHAAILCEIMAGLAGRGLPAAPGADRDLFEAHLAPWMARFFADLEQARAAVFYRHVGMLGRVFMQIETEGFARPA
ncbi:MAG TPA: molecular chaperone TorD family protein [Xanthobacteraceae bacterium]|jgi:TorA maturation chaperone TorD|nr:molecular chaperone TorD family protein [Xanthobacteraceae bacterium]